MKKARQILAIIGIVILIGMYVATLICVLSANENFMSMLMASIYASAVIPVLIWAITFIYKLVKKDDITNEDQKTAGYRHFIDTPAFLLHLNLHTQFF
jgi:hypothetical protein